MSGELKCRPSTVAGAVPTVGELFRTCAQIRSATTAIEYQGQHISHGQLLDRVVLFGHGGIVGLPRRLRLG